MFSKWLPGLLSRRLLISAAACTMFILSFVWLMIYGTRTDIPELPSIVKQILPGGLCLCETSTTFECSECLSCSKNVTVPMLDSGRDWSFEFGKDDQNEALDPERCKASFPGLFEDIIRATEHRKYDHITLEDLDSVIMKSGMIRALIYDGELYVIESRHKDNDHRRKGLGVLHSIHRAMSAIPERRDLDNIEFILTVEDMAEDPETPIWALTRRTQDENIWLMPDFGFWSWGIDGTGPLSSVVSEVIEQEENNAWETKVQQLVWRGTLHSLPKLRRALIDAANNKAWSAVKALSGNGVSKQEEDFISATDQCKYMFIAHAEGRSYSGSLKYRQACRSVIVSHRLQWIQHHHYLLSANGTNQNYVEVERDFSDLEMAMDHLLANPELAKRIADNSVKTFRERYLTPAAEACYWRQLIRDYAKVSFRPALYEEVELKTGRGTAEKRRNARGIRFETFAILESDTQLSYPVEQAV